MQEGRERIGTGQRGRVEHLQHFVYFGSFERDRPVRDQRAVGGGLCACPAGGGALICLVAQRENFQKGRRVVRLALCGVFGVCVFTVNLRNSLENF